MAGAALPRELTERLGGPVGRHAVRRGLFFDPLPWAVASAALTWLALLWRHKPCQQHVAGNTVNAFPRLCYSDVPVVWQNSGLATGAPPLGLDGQSWPPLTALFVGLAQHLAGLFGAHVGPGVTGQQVVDGASVFQLVAAVLLFCCLVATSLCVLLLGRDSSRTLAATAAGRLRSWDALYVAACPAVLAAGLVGWDLFAVALATAALLAWALDRRIASGVLFGLAIGAGTWPVLVLVAVLLVAARARRLDATGPVAASAAAVVLALAGLAAATTGSPWPGVASTWLQREADLGSVWFIAVQLHVPLSAPVLSALVAGLFALWCCRVAWLVRDAPRRPRVAQVAFLLVAGWLLVNKGYAPQQVLWLVPLVPLARPRFADWATWVAAELVYWAAVWGHLGGMLTPGGGSPDVVYWAATAFRALVLLWLTQQVAHDMRHPWDDPVRTPNTDDPAGGVLDHAPDLR